MSIINQISPPEPRAARAADTPNTAALEQFSYRTLHPTDSGHSPAAAMGDHLRGTSGGRVPGSISTLRMVTKGETSFFDPKHDTGGDGPNSLAAPGSDRPFHEAEHA